jgi:GT2 family glycosyltransferase
LVAGVAAASPARVEVVRAEGEDGFARSVREALGLARGAFVAWVNNDVLVTESWLDQLVALVTAHESLGLVGPTANLAPDPQRAEHVPYRLARPGAGLAEATTGAGQLETQAVDLFAREQRNGHRGKWKEVDRLGGFCWLARREVLGRVELLEQGAEEGLFDAGRFSARVRRAGYRLACCRDLFVHHFGSNLVEA